MYRFRDYCYDHWRLLSVVFGAEIAFSLLLYRSLFANLRLVFWLGYAAMLLLTVIAFYGDFRRRSALLAAVAQCLDIDSHALPDVTAGRREAEFWTEQLLSALERVETETVSVQKSREETERAIEAWVHDIKTPLATANLLLESFQEDDLPAMREAIFFLNRRVNQVLYYAKAENITSDLSLRHVSLDELVSGALAEMAPYLVANEVRIERTDLERDIICDPKWLEFVLQNLWENSVKYAGPGVTISLWSETDQGGTFLYVGDDGPGIPAFEERFIFRSGFTGEINRQRTRSTGMGLSLARTLCERMQIRLDLVPASVSGRAGATFRLFFTRDDWFDMAVDERLSAPSPPSS